MREVLASGQQDAELLHSRNPRPEDHEGSRRLDEDFERRPETLSLGSGHFAVFAEVLRPCLANSLHELSKALNGASQGTFKELKCIIKFVLNMADYGLKIKPIKKPVGKAWTMTVFLDSNYAGDTKTRISVTGFCVFLMGVPISWKSHAQRSITLSSSKAEFVALLEATKEIKFIVQVLLSIGIEVTLLVIVCVDNIGAIFMAENVSTSPRTKHVDVCYHFV